MKEDKYYKELSKKEFSKIADKYESDKAGIYKICQKDYPDILKEIEKEPFETLLDCGCGTAPMISLLSEKYPNKQYFGLDLTEKMIKLAKEKNIKNAEFLVGDAENMPYQDESFDCIICSMSAHHYPNIQNFYSSCYRVLKHNGRLIIRDMTSNSKIMKVLEKGILKLGNMLGKGDYKMLELEEVKSGLEKAGFMVLRAEQRKHFRLHVVAKKI